MFSLFLVYEFRSLSVVIYKITKDFPKEEMFGLTSQMRRCSISISSNIAEGSSRSSQKEYARFVEIALGSSFELETQLLIAQAVNYGKREDIQALMKQVDEEQKMMMSFIVKLNQSF